MFISEKVLGGSDVAVQGHVRLELTDPHTKKTVERVEVTNDISEWWQLNARRYARSLFYASNPNQPAVDRAVQVGLNHVFLSDSNESLGIPLIGGSMVGWADKTTYSGASTKRGTINASECLSAATYTKYVWEWATTAGNGTIRSVGMCDLASSDWQVGGIRINSRSPSIDGRALYFPWGVFGVYYDPTNALYFSVQSNVVYRQSVSFAVDDVIDTETYIINPTVTASVPRDNIAWPSNTLVDVTGDGTNLYVSAGTSAIKKFAYPTSLNQDPTESSISVSGRTAMNYLAHDGTYLWVSEGSTVYRVNATSGAIERSFAIAAAPYGMWWYPERSLLAVGMAVGGKNNIYGYDIDGVVRFIATHPTGEYSISSEGGGIYMSDHKSVWLSYYSYGWSSYQCEILASLMTGTRTVLGSDIEKTNLTGMKLTYTFNFS